MRRRKGRSRFKRRVKSPHRRMKRWLSGDGGRVGFRM